MGLSTATPSEALSEHWGSSFRHAFAFEPDPENRTALASNLEAQSVGPRVRIMPFAVGNTNGAVSFTCTNSASSHLTAESGVAIQCRRLDDIKWPLAPTFVKMDIEGAEPEALAGAAALLRQHHPVLAICTYHRSEHLWKIPISFGPSHPSTMCSYDATQRSAGKASAMQSLTTG